MTIFTQTLFNFYKENKTSIQYILKRTMQLQSPLAYFSRTVPMFFFCCLLTCFSVIQPLGLGLVCKTQCNYAALGLRSFKE